MSYSNCLLNSSLPPTNIILRYQFQVTPLGSNFLNLEIPWITLFISPPCRSCHILSFDLRTISGFRITFSVSFAMVITHDIMPSLNLCSYLLTLVHALILANLLAPLVAQRVQNLPAMQEIRVQSLGWDDPLEKGMAIHSWRNPWTEEPGGLPPVESQRVGHDWMTNTFSFPFHLLAFSIMEK